MKDNYRVCSAEIGSVTQAMKAQATLAKAAIPTEVIKSESSSRRGCIYGISYPCAHASNVRTILRAEKIGVRHWSDDI